MTYRTVMDAAFGGDPAASKQFAAVVRRCARIGAGKAGAAEFAEDVGQELWMFAHEHAKRFDPRYELEPYLIATALKTAQAMRRHNLSLGTGAGGAGSEDGEPEREAPAGMDGEASDGLTATDADTDTVDRVDRTAAMDYLLRISPELRSVNDGSMTMSEPSKRRKTGLVASGRADEIDEMKEMMKGQSQSIDALTKMFAHLMQVEAQRQQGPAAPAAQPAAPQAADAKASATPAAPAEPQPAPERDNSARLTGAKSDKAEETEGAALPGEEAAMMPARRYGHDSSEEAALLKSLRQAGGLTQVEMADRLGLKIPTYQSYEYGRSKVPPHILKAAKDISVTPEYSFIRSRYFGKTMTQIARSWCTRLHIPFSPTQLGWIMRVDKGTASRWLNPTITVKMTPPELLMYEHRVQAEEDFLKTAVERHGIENVKEGLQRVAEREEERQRQAGEQQAPGEGAANDPAKKSIN